MKLNVDTKFQIQLTCQNWLAKTQEKHHSGTAVLGLTVGKIHLEAYKEIKYHPVPSIIFRALSYTFLNNSIGLKSYIPTTLIGGKGISARLR